MFTFEHWDLTDCPQALVTIEYPDFRRTIQRRYFPPLNVEVNLEVAMADYKTALQLEALIAEKAGFDPKNIQVSRIGHAGDFKAEFVGAAAAVSASRARNDVMRVCDELRKTTRLKP